MTVLIFHLDRIIAVLERDDDLGQVIYAVRGVPVPIDDDVPARIGNIVVGGGELPRMLIEPVEDRGKDEDIEEKYDDQRGLAERLIIEAGQIGLDPAGYILEFSDYAHAVPL